MADLRTLVRDQMERAGSPSYSFDDLGHRRDRKRRNQRITAGTVGIAVFVAAVWVVTSGGASDQSQTPVVPGGAGTGPTETGPAETGPTETVPPPSVGAVTIGTVTLSGAGCSLEIDGEPIPASPGRLTLVNETDRPVEFELLWLDSEATFRRFEASVAAGGPGPGVSSLLQQREVRPGASGTLIDWFTPGGAYAVACAHPSPIFGRHVNWPFALVGPIVVP